MVPRYKRIGNRLKAAGIKLWYTDCDGDGRPLRPGFLVSGINCLFPYEVNSCVHPGVLLREYGKDLRIMGGFDKIEIERIAKNIGTYDISTQPGLCCTIAPKKPSTYSKLEVALSEECRVDLERLADKEFKGAVEIR